MQRKTMTEIVNQSKSTALERSVKMTGVSGASGGSGGAGHKTFVQCAWRVSISSVQHLREHKNQTNTEMKQRWGLDNKYPWHLRRFRSACSKQVPLLQFFLVCASMVSYVVFVLSLFVLSSSLRFLGIFSYTVNPLYIDTRYNDIISYNYN